MPMQLDPTNPINNTIEQDQQDLIEAIDILRNLFDGGYVETETPEYIDYDRKIIDRARTFLAKFEE